MSTNALDAVIATAVSNAAANTDAEDAASTLLDTLSTQLTAAIAAAKNAGATTAQLQAVQDLADRQKAASSKMAAAIVKNTPAA